MKRLTPIKAIRVHCIDCSAGIKSDVRNCLFKDCPLYIYRLGKNPNRKGIGGRKAPVDQFDVEAKMFNKRATQVGKSG